MTANVLYLLATRHGPISVVAPLAALYPVSTVILALVVDREPLRAVQVVGLLLAVLTLVLVNV
jgi:drug/metabolite transporter (DMT)-like permease